MSETIIDTSETILVNFPVVPEHRRYTVLLDYFATGEGRTLAIMYVVATDQDHARRLFAERFGDWYARGTDVQEGWTFTGHPAHDLVTERVRAMLGNDAAHVVFDAMLHFNFS